MNKSDKIIPIQSENENRYSNSVTKIIQFNVIPSNDPMMMEN